MKILIIHNDYQQHGGETYVVNAQIEILRKNGHNLSIYWRDNSSIKHYSPPQKIRILSNTLYNPDSYREIEHLVRNENPDLAHIHNVFPLISPSAYRALSHCGIPMVQMIHNYRLMCPNGVMHTHGQVCERCLKGNTTHAVRLKCFRQSYLLSLLYALSIGIHRRIGTFQMIDRFIVLNAFTGSKLEQSGIAGRDKIEYINNFLNGPLPDPGLPELRKPYIVYIGRLSPEKGVDELIQAMAGIKGLSLKILGVGPEMERLRAIAQGLKPRNIEFLGFLSGDRKWEILRQALATALPSFSYENFPLSILDSWAVGTPVIVRGHGSLPYLVDDGQTGWVYDHHDKNDLAAKLRWIHEHPQEAVQMGARGRRLLERKYSPQAVYQQLIEIFTRLVSNRQETFSNHQAHQTSSPS